MSKTILSFFLILFVLSFTCFAQEQAEEEEPIQARPSPIMQQKMTSKQRSQMKSTATSKSSSSNVSGQKNAQGKTNQMMKQNKMLNKHQQNKKMAP